jgi:hypothetical protein
MHNEETICVGCLCTDTWGCPSGCAWVRLAPRYRLGLCSACRTRSGRRRYRQAVRQLRRRKE